ncbi:MAG: hypothetical protein Q7U21_04660 [Lutibacter sp.]|nr:hypothetical protein [Lutibacter sp.]
MKITVFKIISVLFLTLIVSCNSSQKEKELELKERELDLKERELNLKTIETKTAVKVKINPKNIAQQKFNNFAPQIEKSNGAVIANQETFIGDLNYDDLDDAVVWFTLSPAIGGNARLGEGLSVYLNTGNDMKVFGGYEPEYMFKVINISNNRIKITKQEYAANDYPGWPSIEIVKYLMLSGNKVMESNNN